MAGLSAACAPAPRFSCVAAQKRIAIVPAHEFAPGISPMAAHTDPQNEPGQTDMAEHLRTWRGFISFMKWQAFGAAAILVLLAIFRTHD
jgi:hypothetical protein